MTVEAPSICVTVDVEDFFLPRPPGFDTVFAAMDNAEYGIGRIMDLLESCSAKGTFFVDVFNRETLDVRILARACAVIAERGHEVGLHTHPSFPKGRRGYGMQQVMSTYDLAAQRAFVAEGVALIRQWSGVEPRVHRAGGYGANAGTLQALRENGITLDSSLLHGYAGCELNQFLPVRNRATLTNGVLELPVSVTKNHFGFRVSGFEITPFSMVQKIDLDWLDGPELQEQIMALHQAGVNPIVVFMHSYTFLDTRRNFRPNLDNVGKLKQLLQFVNTIPGSSIESLSAATERAGLSTSTATEPDPLPELRFYLNEDARRWLGWARHTVHFGHLRYIASQLGIKTSK